MNEMRNTVQRQIVLDSLIKLNSHSNVDELYTEIQKEHPSISKTTVYRNLRQLAKTGVIREVALADGLERYDEHPSRHYHFKCRSCGKIFDMDIEYIKGIDDTVQGKYGFQVDEHELVFRGLCDKCGKTKN
jgi:Fe2+ or Zn2+ uptake regulation protein